MMLCSLCGLGPAQSAVVFLLQVPPEALALRQHPNDPRPDPPTVVCDEPLCHRCARRVLKHLRRFFPARFFQETV